jgi:hypothetical protein
MDLLFKTLTTAAAGALFAVSATAPRGPWPQPASRRGINSAFFRLWRGAGYGLPACVIVCC